MTVIYILERRVQPSLNHHAVEGVPRKGEQLEFFGKLYIINEVLRIPERAEIHVYGAPYDPEAERICEHCKGEGSVPK